jgi:hypothetical protein
MKGRNRAERRKASRKHGKPDPIVKAVTEFYIEVAHTLDLPPKALPVAPPPPPRQTREEAIRAIRTRPALYRYREWWLPILAALLLVVTGAYYWWPADRLAVPEGFRGTWVSHHASYAGRMIVVSMETIEIVSGLRAATGPLPVISSTVKATAEGVRLRLVFGKTGSEQTMEMLLHPGRPATLTLLRPADVVWERLEAPRAGTSDSARTPDA